MEDEDKQVMYDSSKHPETKTKDWMIQMMVWKIWP